MVLNHLGEDDDDGNIRQPRPCSRRIHQTVRVFVNELNRTRQKEHSLMALLTSPLWLSNMITEHKEDGVVRCS